MLLPWLHPPVREADQTPEDQNCVVREGLPIPDNCYFTLLQHLLRDSNQNVVTGLPALNETIVNSP